MHIPFPFFPSHSVLIAGHRCPTPLSSRPSITYSIYIPFPFLLAGHIGITKHLSLTLLLPILQLSHIPFPFSASTAILITLHLSHASLIHLAPLSHSISIPILQHCPHRCASLSSSSHLFSIIHTFISSRLSIFHFQSPFSQPNNHSTPYYCHYTRAGAANVYRIILGACLNSSPFLLSASFSLHSASIPICYFIAIPLALSFTPPLSIPFAFLSSNKQPFLYIPTPLPIHTIFFSLFL